MAYFEKFTLTNGINVIYKHVPGTPRIALHTFMAGGNVAETTYGVNNLLARLLLKGTETRTAEELVNELDYYGITLDTDAKNDYLKLRAVCLNEDLDKTLEILSDVLLYSTFKEIEKEKRITQGELQMDLESPKSKAFDNLIKNLYPKHPYGVTSSVLLGQLEIIQEHHVRGMLDLLCKGRNITVAIVGDLDRQSVETKLQQYLGVLPAGMSPLTDKISSGSLDAHSLVTIVKEDASQAQILQSWFAPKFGHSDHPPLVVTNAILGAGGLSTRLFIELREKKGLAYSVHSMYEPFKYSGYFAVYIGTNPDNMETCFHAFDQEIKKMIHTPVSAKELMEVKTNVLGKREVYHETNSQIAHYLGYYEMMGVGADYDALLPQKIQEVTSEDIQRIANQYLSQCTLTSIVAPQKYINLVCPV